MSAVNDCWEVTLQWSNVLTKTEEGENIFQDNLALVTGLTMGICHRKTIRKLTFRVLDFRRSELILPINAAPQLRV